jgi:hypothetical protein
MHLIKIICFFIKDDQDLQVKFLMLEEEKYSALQEYRQQKQERLQRNVEANENVARYLQSLFMLSKGVACLEVEH